MTEEEEVDRQLLANEEFVTEVRKQVRDNIDPYPQALAIIGAAIKGIRESGSVGESEAHLIHQKIRRSLRKYDDASFDLIN